MAYPNSFHRLVIQGTIYNDIFNTSLAIGTPGSNVGAVTQAQSDATAAAVSSWWSLAAGDNAQITASAVLTGIKLNRIDPSGHYQDPTTFQTVLPVAVAGQGVAGTPAQIAVVATLRTAVERGLAAKGRMFFPSANGFGSSMDASGHATTANALRFANAVANLITRINSSYGGAMKVCTVSNVGSGAQRYVTNVTVGRVPDTMRSRRNKLTELPVANTVPPGAL